MPSSVIKYFSYDAATETLKIIFVTDMIYLYKKVPEKIYKMLKASGSKGRYFNRHIKDKFKFQKLEEE
ncbi:KTSC domain-containing protein [Pedobacter sp. ISL-68]|uniref:KTSC domain-containing protein n=1 Tax=unclassified Pedobacter TaxID=2628915 RepID=UPI001BEA25BD|nr:MULTISPECIES: KTSC domain-containing protein [unclassified Pedobacter]MBT2561515.1 KTSC domain-containing protein [Pedobacter sp. ISL-64]MBT2590904.1 KTSC domain-containing protein [Pedobacter sp. ISL-68]